MWCFTICILVLMGSYLQLATLANRRPQERLDLLRIRDTREVWDMTFLCLLKNSIVPGLQMLIFTCDAANHFKCALFCKTPLKIFYDYTYINITTLVRTC